MAPPMKKKKKGSSKGSKGGKKDQWSYDGGVTIDDTSSNDQSLKRPRRQNQARDDKEIRTKIRSLDRKRKKDFEDKMKTKIRFTDIIKDNNINDTDSNNDDEDTIKMTRIPSSIGVIDRLRYFMKSSSKRNKKVSDDNDFDDDDDDDNDGEDDGEDDNDDDGNNDDENGNDGNDDNDVNIDEDEDDNDGITKEIESNELDDDNDNDDDDDDNNDNDNVENNDEGAKFYDWFFSTEENIGKKYDVNDSDKMKRLSVFDDLEIYGNLNEKVSLKAINKIGDIPRLGKLWLSDSNQKITNPYTKSMLPYLSSYVDALLEGRNHENDKDILETILTHISVHVMKSRMKQIRHNQKLKKKVADIMQKAAAESVNSKKKKNKSALQDKPVIEGMQDQGFCRPKVLILCPTRNSVMNCIESIRNIFGDQTNISSLDKLVEEYGFEDNEQDGNPHKKKPEDWESIFSGNMDDDFKMGIQITPGKGKGSGPEKGAYLRLFSDFYISDIIIASPLGLRLVVENSKGKLNFDFLSSIEVLFLYQADVMFMQNWDHVEFIVRSINKLPQSDHETDFSRVRPYFLEGDAAKHRQLILTSHFNDPMIQAFFRESAMSIAGKIRVKKDWSDGFLSQVAGRVHQVFQVVPCQSFEDQESARFEYFRDNVLAQILRLKQGNTLIVTPSYLSYVAVRNELLKKEVNAAFICEYSRESEISRGRSRFFHGTKDILLYSGRAHFYRRFMIKGALHLIFYSLPEYAHFYPEIVNLLGHADGGGLGSNTSCLVLFTKYEKMALERIVGSKRCEQIFSSTKTTFMFC